MAKVWSQIFSYHRIRNELGSGAFLSYSGDRDRQWLPRLRKAIEKQARPWYEPPRIRVFLDESGVSIGPQLRRKVEAGLARSDWLIVMASPESRESSWVDWEIDWWLTHKSSDTILLVVTAGALVWDHRNGDWDKERSTALPPRLVGKFAEEPVWKSVVSRWGDDGILISPSVDSIALSVAAVVRRRSEEELKSEGLHDTQRNLRTAVTALVLLAVLLLLTTSAWAIALAQRAEAERQRDHAIAQQLIDQSEFLGSRDPFVARLKALAAWRLDPSPETRRATLEAALNPQTGILKGSVPMSAVSFSPDGKLIATGGDDGIVRIWDSTTQQMQQAPLIGHTQGITSLAFTPNGKLVSSSGDGSVRLWDLASREHRGDAFNSKGGSVNSLAVSPDGKTLLTAESDSAGPVKSWNIATQHLNGKLLEGPLKRATSVRFSPDGARFATVTSGEVQLWDSFSRTPIGPRLMPARHDKIMEASFSPDGSILATVGFHGSIQIWDTRTQLPQGPPITWDGGAGNSISFSPDGATLAVAYENGKIALWDISRRSQVGSPFSGHTSSVREIAFSPDGRTLVSASEDTTVRLWNTHAQHSSGAPLEIGDHHNTALSPDGETLAVSGASENAGLRLWNLETRRQAGEPIAPTDSSFPTPVAFSVDGGQLAVGVTDFRRQVRFWDTKRRHPIGAPLEPHNQPAAAVAFSPTGNLLASSDFQQVRLWDAKSHKQMGPNLHVNARKLSISPNGRILVTDSSRHTLVFWDLISHRKIGESPKVHTAQITALSFSPDGSIVATASRDNTVRFWSPGTREQIGEPLTGHQAGVTAISFSPFGGILATGSMDDTIRLWDVTTRRQIGDPLIGHEADRSGVGYSQVDTVSFHPDGKTIVSSARDGTARVWNVESAVEPAQSLCTWSKGAFSRTLWKSHVPPGPEPRNLCP